MTGTSPDAAREAARQDNGQFGTQPRPEADVDLTSALVPTNAATITAALRDAGLTGEVEPCGLASITYVDDTDGNRYDIVTHGDAFQIRSEDTDSFSLVLPINQQSATPQQVVSRLREVIRNAYEVRAFSSAADRWAATPAEDRGSAWVDPQLDAEKGVLSGHSGWSIEGFTTTYGDYGDTEMRVCLSDPDLEDGLTFYYARDRGGETRVWREGSSAPLARWEEQALDGQLMHLMNRDGQTRSIRELFNDVVRRTS